MKLDVIDVFRSAIESIFGRIILVILVVNVFGALGLILQNDSEFEIMESFVYALPLLLMTILGGIGLVTLPLLFAFTFAFARFDMHLGFLAIPSILSFVSLYKPYL